MSANRCDAVVIIKIGAIHIYGVHFVWVYIILFSYYMKYVKHCILLGGSAGGVGSVITG